MVSSVVFVASELLFLQEETKHKSKQANMQYLLIGFAQVFIKYFKAIKYFVVTNVYAVKVS